MKHMNKVKRIAAFVLTCLLSCIAFACNPSDSGNSSSGGGTSNSSSSSAGGTIGGGGDSNVGGDNGLEDPNDKDDLIDDWGM